MTLDELHAAIEAVMAPAEARMAAKRSGPPMAHPSAMAWATDSELAELHRLQLLVATHHDHGPAAARARVVAKRAARRRARLAQSAATRQIRVEDADGTWSEFAGVNLDHDDLDFGRKF
jgi:hypothetical protein